MKTLVGAVNRVLQRAQVRVPDGRPLYGYRIDEQDVESLRCALSEYFGTNTRFVSAAGAAFCAFAAMNMHREADDAELWAWAPIERAVGFSGTYAELVDGVEQGLRYWKRPLIRAASGRQFLVTLMCEGGLPLSLLQREGARLRRYFRELLLARETYPNVTAVSLARGLDGLLPLLLRTSVVHELASELVEAIVQLRRAEPDPERAVALLSEAKWAQTLPLPLGEKIADELVRGLVAVPPQAARREARGLEIATLLRIDAAAHLQREARLPPELSEEWVAEKAGVSADALPARLYLSLATTDGAQQSVAVATRSLAGPYVIAAVPHRAIRDPALVRDEVRVVISTGPKLLGTFVPAGGAALPVGPLVFTEELDGHTGRLVGFGSVRTRRDSLLVAVPSDSSLEALEGAVEPLMALEDDSRTVYRVRGSARWEREGGTCQRA